MLSGVALPVVDVWEIRYKRGELSKCNYSNSGSNFEKQEEGHRV